MGPATCAARQRTAYSVTVAGPAFNARDAVAARVVFVSCKVVAGRHQRLVMK